MPGDDAAAVEALAQDHVVDRSRAQIGRRRANDVLGQLVGIRVPQGAFHGGADGRTQGRNDHGFGHRCLRLDQYENVILSV